MTDDEVMLEALRHFVHLDESNAAVHCGAVRYSPLTFRLAEALSRRGVDAADSYVCDVVAHVGQYEEDKGR